MFQILFFFKNQLPPPPNTFPTRQFKELKIMTYKSVHSSKAKIGP